MLQQPTDYDFISDLQISNTAENGGTLKTEGNTYKTLMVPGCKYIPLETFEKIIELAKQGAIILFYEKFPDNVSGWADNKEKTRKFRQLQESLSFNPAGEHVRVAETGKGKIIMGDNLGELLAMAKIRHEPMAGEGISFIRRNTEGGSVYFIKNDQTENQPVKSFEGWLPLSVHASSAAIFNPMKSKNLNHGRKLAVKMSGIFPELPHIKPPSENQRVHQKHGLLILEKSATVPG